MIHLRIDHMNRNPEEATLTQEAKRLPLNEGSCVDSDGGYTFWDSIPQKFCKENTYSVLFKGLVTKLVSKSGTVFSVSVRDISFSLTTIGTEDSCGLSMLKTEHPQIYPPLPTHGTTDNQPTHGTTDNQPTHETTASQPRLSIKATCVNVTIKVLLLLVNWDTWPLAHILVNPPQTAYWEWDVMARCK
ncbi:Protein of unknown function [Cotesia congregata]|uniref:Uncharacterized protein n=1 Tax=Cotesia congregata TaxID=51543 RepID=A0A8J2HF76_COTCN|nr:Protein of unknown function [Cotesia congregata]